MSEEHKGPGRPRKEIDFHQLEKLCGMQCLETEIAGWFEMSVDTLETRVKEETGLNFSEYYAEKRGNGKIAIRRKQMQLALKGNPTMLIWLGKQHLDQADKQELKHSGALDPVQEMTFDQRKAYIDALVARRNGTNGN